MKLDWISLLGGLTAGAAMAALANLASKEKLLGQGVVTGGPGGGFGGGSYAPGGGGSYAPGGFGSGVIVGPPGGIPSGMGPTVMVVEEDDDSDIVGPVVSVPPIVHGPAGIYGDSFVGVNVAPWFWPLYPVYPIYEQPAPPQSMICKKIEDEDGEEAFLCERRYPVQTVAWGPPAGWL